MAEGGDLPPVPMETSCAEKEHISLKDLRERVEETRNTVYEAVAQLHATDGSATWNGTGFLLRIEDSAYLVTSAHNVVHKDDLGVQHNIKSLEVSFGRTDETSRPYGTINLTQEHLAKFILPKEFQEQKNNRTELDWAHLRLNECVRDGQLPQKHFLLPRVWPVSTTKALEVTGYPGYPPEGKRRHGVPGYPKNSMWTVRCAQGVWYTRYHVCYVEWTQTGNSGSPVFYRDADGQCYVVGIHAGFDGFIKTNLAVLMSQPFPQFLSEQSVLPHSAIPPEASDAEDEAIYTPRDVVFVDELLVVRCESGACYLQKKQTRSRLRGVRARGIAVYPSCQALVYTCMRRNAVVVYDIHEQRDTRVVLECTEPWGVAVNEQDDFAVGDHGRDKMYQVIICDSRGTELLRIGRFGMSTKEFRHIDIIRWIDGERLAVLDPYNCRVVVLNKGGRVVCIAEPQPKQRFKQPSGLCVRKYSSTEVVLCIADSVENCISSYNLKGTFMEVEYNTTPESGAPWGLEYSRDQCRLAICLPSARRVFVKENHQMML